MVRVNYRPDVYMLIDYSFIKSHVNHLNVNFDANWRYMKADSRYGFKIALNRCIITMKD